MLKVSEIFGPTIQGEGALMGQPTMFVRLGGCDYRCDWCDTLYAVLPNYNKEWKKATEEEVVDELEHSACSGAHADCEWVTVSGGNPALQDCEELIRQTQSKGFKVAMETQGSICRAWFTELDHLVLSPKPPSSGEQLDESVFRECLENAPYHYSIKLVVKDMDDYEWARGLVERHNLSDEQDVFLQPCNTNTLLNLDSYKWLVAQALDNPIYGTRILPQLHVLAWGGERGV
jgi:7-carboxy-7-deazaguanine synthase